MAKVAPVDTTSNFNINRVSTGTHIIGSIEAVGDLRIDGLIEGTIVADGKVVVGETGRIKGDIKAKVLDMMGELEGNIIISDTVFLKKTARVNGNLTTDKLIVESGAILTGTCVMGMNDVIGSVQAKEVAK